MKLRLKGAQKGHSLLKKKSDALTVRFRQILMKIVEVSICLRFGDVRLLLQIGLFYLNTVSGLMIEGICVLSCIYLADENIDGRSDEKCILFIG